MRPAVVESWLSGFDLGSKDHLGQREPQVVLVRTLGLKQSEIEKSWSIAPHAHCVGGID